MHIYILQNQIVQKKKNLSNDGIAYTVRVLQRVKIWRPLYPPKKRYAVVGALISILTPFFRCFHLCVTPRALMMITSAMV